MFFKLLKDALKIKQVRSKILFTIFIVLVFRIGTTITVPGVNAKSLEALNGLSFLNMLSLVSGNALRNFSVFALGVSPYITASIVVQLLQMDILPKFVEWGKQGEVGRRKLNQATRYIALVLAFVQSIGITAGFHTLSSAKLVATPNWQTYLLIGFLLTTGSMIVTWLGEQITDKGYGNGVSMIIFAGIVAAIPGMIKSIYVDYFVNVPSSRITSSIIFVTILIIAVLLIVYFTTFVQQAEYKIPIQYTKIAQGAPSSSYLPLKVNPAGVIPVIFASSLMQFPIVIAQFLGKGDGNGWGSQILRTMNSNNWCDPDNLVYSIGLIIYIALTIFFAYFYTSITFNPLEIANNMKKSGGFIPGIRPGKPTVEYLQTILNRIVFIGACGLVIVQVVPFFFNGVFGANVSFGGTSLIIIVGVVLETIKKIESQMLVRNYSGFLSSKGSSK